MKQLSDGCYPADRVCPICHKTFPVMYPGLWAYKHGFRDHFDFMCGYSCMTEFIRRRERPKSQGKRNLERQEKIQQMVEDGIPTKQIQKELGVSPQMVAYYIRKKLRA